MHVSLRDACTVVFSRQQMSSSNVSEIHASSRTKLVESLQAAARQLGFWRTREFTFILSKTSAGPYST
jgi:hypothetical protein